MLAKFLVVFTGKVECSLVGETEWCKTLTASTFVLFAKRLVKLTPGVDFTNVFCAHFSYKRLFSSYILFRLYEKRARNRLVK